MKNIAKEERTHRVVHPSHPVHKRDKNTGAGRWQEATAAHASTRSTQAEENRRSL